MARNRSLYRCQSCGGTSPKWQGRCPHCGAWNTLEEEAGAAGAPPKGLGARRGRVLDACPLDAPIANPTRIATRIGELDRPLGGGLVPGSAVLLGGDPGIGKSTLLLQVLARLAAEGRRTVYVSGEESPAQIQMRARRLKVEKTPVALIAATDVRDIITTLKEGQPVDVVVIDSIQTVHVDTLESAPGTVSQVRSAAAELIRHAKASGTAIILVGHVTKDGQLAGPRVLEHMVDAVLYFEGERGHEYRILRSVKNRFGATDEIGVFQMTGGGLEEVVNPSALFLPEDGRGAPGTAVFAGIEGSRPILCEIQALVAETSAANPRRAVVGWDAARLAMILAVLDARCGLGLARADVYLNVAGGLRIREPAADLAVAAALISAALGQPLDPGTVIFGEISLAGGVRPVARSDARLKEAEKLGFRRAILPAAPPRRGAKKGSSNGRLQRHVCRHVADLVALVEHLPGDARTAADG
ncbi:MAG: DNA repair protein RadA [Alphaproteobacteria bacterium]|nr:MAG: DNA repair protein RadA [Alphaproteobacteria bacterium]